MEGKYGESYEYKPVTEELADTNPAEKEPITTGPAQIHDLKNAPAKKPGIETPKDFEQKGRMAA